MSASQHTEIMLSSYKESIINVKLPNSILHANNALIKKAKMFHVVRECKHNLLGFIIYHLLV